MKGHTCILNLLSSLSKSSYSKGCFLDQAMNRYTSLKGAKTCKIENKGVFLAIVTNFGGKMVENYEEEKD